MLARLLESGIKYVFVSNSDNLGATLDVDLLAFFAKSDSAFTMEVRSVMPNDRRADQATGEFDRGADQKYR